MKMNWKAGYFAMCVVALVEAGVGLLINRTWYDEYTKMNDRWKETALNVNHMWYTRASELSKENEQLRAQMKEFEVKA